MNSRRDPSAHERIRQLERRVVFLEEQEARTARIIELALEVATRDGQDLNLSALLQVIEDVGAAERDVAAVGVLVPLSGPRDHDPGHAA